MASDAKVRTISVRASDEIRARIKRLGARERRKLGPMALVLIEEALRKRQGAERA